jgi:hypothetical protein
MNTKIWATNKDFFDIGCKVIKWDEPEGFSFIKSNNYNKRNYNFQKLQDKIQNFAVHWAANYRAKHVFNGLNYRKLSCNFIIDDDCDNNGFASIYQCLPIVYSGYSQGNGFNDLGAGVEIAYQPDLWNENRYDPNDMAKWKVPSHDNTIAKIHGTTLKVHLPTIAQMNSLKKLIYGYCSLFPKVKPEFPKYKDGTYITTTLNYPFNYNGLVNHYHLTKRKIDCAGLDMKDIEESVKKMLVK